jgi:hypothetical protein
VSLTSQKNRLHSYFLFIHFFVIFRSHTF